MPRTRSRELTASLGLALLLSGIPCPASAASVTGHISFISDILDLQEPVVGGGRVPGPLSDSLSRGPGPAALGAGSASASYRVEFGRIRLNAAMEVNAPSTLDPPVNRDSGTTAHASWMDAITFTAPGLAGTTGYFRPRLGVTGSYDGEAAGGVQPFVSSASGLFIVTVDVSSQLPLPGRFQQRAGRCMADPSASNCEALGDPFGSWLLDPVPFVFGDTFALAVLGSAIASGRSVEGGSFRASAQLGNTIEWLGITEVTDAGGAPIVGYTLSSASGFDYAAGVVPEPGTALLLAAGLAGLAFNGRAGWSRRIEVRPPQRAE